MESKGCVTDAGEGITREKAIAAFSTEDKLLALSHALGAIVAQISGESLSVKMNNSAGDSVWINLPPPGSGDFIRWG